MRILSFVFVLAFAGRALAQPAPAPAPAAPPAQYPAPAPQAQYPAPAPQAAPYPAQPGYAPGYPPQPGYAQPMYAPRPELPYAEDRPIPPGYRLDERPRRGLLIAGPIVLGVPYVLGLTVASAADFDNESGWLALPVLGPWITMFQREEVECGDEICVDVDPIVRTWLVLDGVMQGTGATLLILGLAYPRKVLVYDGMANLQLAPGPVGLTGQGLTLRGSFF